MTYDELRVKFEENAAAFLSPQARTRVADEIRRLDLLPDAKTLLELAT
jgi:hypothetical protein